MKGLRDQESTGSGMKEGKEIRLMKLSNTVSCESLTSRNVLFQMLNWKSDVQ